MRNFTKKMIRLNDLRQITEYRILNCRGAIKIIQSEINEESTEEELNAKNAKISVLRNAINGFQNEYEQINIKGREILKQDLEDILSTGSTDDIEQILNEL